MITDYRPLPITEYEVAWSGEIERSRIQAQQRPAPELPRSTFSRVAPGKEAVSLVLAAMNTKPAGRVWSIARLVGLTGLSTSSVGTALRDLQRRGLVCAERVDYDRGRIGQQIRAWLR